MIKIFNQDCREYMTKNNDEHIDLTITSPPYDNLRKYNNNSTWNYDIFKNIADGLMNITKTGGIVVWVVADATIDGSETGSSFKQALYFKDIGFKIHDTMIWQKPTFSAVGGCKKRYHQVFEYMFIFSKGNIKTFNMLKDRKNKNYGKIFEAPTIRKPDGKLRKNNSVIIKDFGLRFNVWNMATSKRSLHPAPFPEQLARDHILSWSNKGDVVFDPFMGSGTTGLSAIKLNRHFIGIEIDPEYYKIAEKRLRIQK